ncbi:MAG: hypothetical protein KIT16_04545 [Rhodospirillaceae bacterium]|nr:hypothetical protein [Rhodospirillaceae bacterium]
MKALLEADAENGAEAPFQDDVDAGSTLRATSSPAPASASQFDAGRARRGHMQPLDHGRERSVFGRARQWSAALSGGIGGKAHDGEAFQHLDRLEAARVVPASRRFTAKAAKREGK